MAGLHADTSGTERSRLALSWKLDRNSMQKPVYSNLAGDFGQQSHPILR